MRAKVASICLLACSSLGLAGAQGVASAGPAAPPLRLTLDEAIHRGLQANLTVLLAGSSVQQAAGSRERKLAALLPHISAESYANLQNRNLRAFGISFPGLPSVVGPFSNYDVRLYAQQNVLDLAAWRSWQASEQVWGSAKLDERNARDIIMRAVAALYLNAESAAARAQAAQSRVADAEALFQLAGDMHNAGTATGVDVLRAQVQLANERQLLLIAQNQYRLALLELARAIGMEPGSPMELAESLAFQPLREQSAARLVDSALAVRADAHSLAAQRQALVEEQRANRARNYPKLSIYGNYGAIGRSVGGMEPTGVIQGQLDITVFDRDRHGEAVEIAARIRAIDARIADLRRGIAEEVRGALLDLESARQQVDVAQQGQQLAQRELEMSRDRFQQGTTNNIEVITAQNELARAEENYILAVTSYTDGTFALARALGETEAKIREGVEEQPN